MIRCHWEELRTIQIIYNIRYMLSSGILDPYTVEPAMSSHPCKTRKVAFQCRCLPIGGSFVYKMSFCGMDKWPLIEQGSHSKLKTKLNDFSMTPGFFSRLLNSVLTAYVICLNCYYSSILFLHTVFYTQAVLSYNFFHNFWLFACRKIPNHIQFYYTNHKTAVL